MNSPFSCCILAFFLLFSCQKETERVPEAQANSSFEGTYAGYRSQRLANELATDSTKITLEVSRISDSQIQILQTSPNEFSYLVTMKNHRFSYDRGLGEADCGAASIQGEGVFQNNSLVLLETLRCTRNTSYPDRHVQLRAFKQR
ncbi:hypothetical protein [Arundinibacter roseus]|uniref:Uncharacterized protein n=1 Tax=Arundinibacter roseus TaxID=2070510 RepID=A0A4V2XAM6_9BACT|nr:hypothetical protein [Arundinibacter roseus]TDB67975.1 hypothetical protein EZE20_03350 [Arundinibacter roseus]